MRTSVLIALCGLFAAEAAAQVQVQEPAVASDPPVVVAAATVAAAAGAPQQPEPVPQPPPRRRGSMVGYIDDATVATRIRLRVDSAFENTSPDRAEFFYAKCGCFGGDAPGPRDGAANNLDFQQVNIWAEYAVGSLFSVFGHLPFRWIHPQSFIPDTGPGFGDESGVSDFRVGAKVALASTDAQSLTAQAQVYFPTGDAARGLGTDHASVEPSVLYYTRLADAVTVEGQLGVWLPIGGASADPADPDEDFAGNVLTYGIGTGVEVVRGRRARFGPVLEFVGWRVLSGFESIPGDPADVREVADTNIVNVKIGGRLTIDDRHSFYVGYGRALTDATWYEDIVRIEYRVGFD